MEIVKRFSPVWLQAVQSSEFHEWKHKKLQFWSLQLHTKKLSKEPPNWFRSPWEANAKSAKPKLIGALSGSRGEETGAMTFS